MFEGTEFQKKRKTTRFLNGNAEFVKIFNQGNVGSEWNALFMEAGLKLELKSVEKVFEENHLPYQTGIYFFEVSKK